AQCLDGWRQVTRSTRAKMQTAMALSWGCESMLMAAVVPRWKQVCVATRHAAAETACNKLQAALWQRGLRAAATLVQGQGKALMALLVAAWRQLLADKSWTCKAEAERQALLAAMRSRSGALMEWHHSRGREKWLATQSFTSWKMQVRSLRWARSYALSSVVSSDLALIRQVLAELRRFVVVTRNQRAADGDEARLGALDQLQSRLVTWHSDRGLDRLLLVQTIGAWRNVSLELRSAVCACFAREAGCDQALLAVILAEWRLLLRQTAREHAVALNGELRAQCHWRATLVLA
ncbi:unnamed protein product, partial [Polarella glacialis]